MNFLNALKSAKGIIDTSSEVYNVIRSSISSDVDKSPNAFEKVKLTEFVEYESSVSNNPFCIFVSRKLVAKNAPQTFCVIFVPAALSALRTGDYESAKQLRLQLNGLGRLANSCVEHGLAEKFLSLALQHPTWTDVHLACALGLPTYVRESCQQGDALSILNSPTPDEGFFPLHLAAERGFVRLVDALIDLGADVLKTDLRAWNTLHFAVQAPDRVLGVAVLEAIAKKCPAAFAAGLNRLSENEVTPLMMALAGGHLSALRVILAADRVAALHEHGSRIFAGVLDAQCLDLILTVDPALLDRQTEAHNVLHRPFNGYVLKVIAARAPQALSKQIGAGGLTPLHAACRRADLDAVMALLSYGAPRNALDDGANTPLHTAALINAAPIVQLLLCFGVDWRMKNAKGDTALALAIQASSTESANLLKRVANWESSRAGAAAAPILSARDARQRSALAGRLALSPEQRQQCARVLTLDGGGIRGLVSIQALLELESRLSGNVIDHFNWLAGTSTGAILALALADGTTPRDCLRLYLRLKDEVFLQRPDAQPATPQAQSHPQAPRLRLYSSEKIEHLLRQHFGDNRTLAQLRTNKRVFVTATRANVNPPELVLFRNYGPPSHLDASTAKSFIDPSCIPIWKAARCSSAAPTYFSSVDGVYMDGGLVANNPTLDLLVDIHLYNDSLLLEGKKEREIACVVSLGTGRMPVKNLSEIDVGVPATDQGSSSSSGGMLDNFTKIYRNITAIQNLKTILVEQVACSDGHVVDRARAWSHSLGTPYFRFTPQLTQDVPLDVTDNVTLVMLLWVTKCYLNENSDFDSLISFLQSY